MISIYNLKSVVVKYLLIFKIKVKKSFRSIGIFKHLNVFHQDYGNDLYIITLYNTKFQQGF